MKSGLKNRRAMTLVETLFCAALLPLIMGACFVLLRTGWDSWELVSAQTRLSQCLSQSEARILGDLRQTGASVITNVPADNSWYPSITFNIAQDVLNQQTIWGPAVTYSLGGANGKQLIRTQNNVSQTIADNIISVQFGRQNTAPNIINIQFKSSVPTYRGDETLTSSLNSEVYVRN